MAENLRILHLAFLKEWRGGEQQVVYLFDECRKKDCLQWVLCSKDAAIEGYCHQNGIPFYSLKKGTLQYLKNASFLRKLSEMHHVDIIHVHDSHSHTLAYIAWILGMNKPIVISRRVDFPIRESWFSLKKYNFDGIKKIICVSEQIRKILEPEITDKSKLCVIYSGIDTERFSKQRKSGILHRELNIADDIPIVGNIAAIAPHKDYYTFVDTASEFLKTGGKGRFIIFGQGPLFNKIKEYIRSKNLENDVIMAGFRNDIPEILPEFDVFLFTSETEGLGTSILDAFACGVPVVATKAGGIPEIIEDGTNGLLAEIKNPVMLAQKLRAVLENPELKHNLVNNAKRTLKKFSKATMAEKTYKIYKEIYFNS